MKRKLFNLFSLLVTLTLLLPAGGMSVTAQEPPSPRSNATQSSNSSSPPMVPSSLPSPAFPAEPATQARVRQSFGQLPLYFVENQGQLDEPVAYYIQGSDKTLYFTPEGVTFALNEQTQTTDRRPQMADRDALYRPGDDWMAQRPEERGELSEIQNQKSEIQRWAIKLDFMDANPNVRPIGQDKTEAVISYFKGQPDQWHAGLPTYASIVYPDLWPGIDLVYYGTVNQLKYEFVVHPGADPAQIRLAYRGADVALNPVGQLQVAILVRTIGANRDKIPASEPITVVRTEL